LTESSYAPLSEIPKHAHENPYFVFTLNGGQEESIGSRKRIYIPGTLAFHAAGETHSEKLGPVGMRCLHVEFGSKWLERHEEVTRVVGDGSHFQNGRLGWLAKRVYGEFCNMDDVAPAAIEGLVLELLADASRVKRLGTTGKRPRWLVQARELIEARFSEAISVSDIAAAVNIHPVHLSRQFLRHYHRTVADYTRQLRVESACRKISSSNQSLADVAIEAGFSDQAHFTRVCKRLTGRTPAEFRCSAGKC
jgi:AraC family transcriptional regulator